MSLTFPTQAELKALELMNLRNVIAGFDTASDAYDVLKAGARAHVMEGIVKRIRWASEQIFPDSAADEYLQRHADKYNITPRDPSKAEGDAVFTGTPGSTIPVGQLFTKADGWEYETTEGGNIPGGGSLTLASIATVAGADGNCEDATEFTVTNPPAGVDATATANGKFVGGRDTESSAELLARVLLRIRFPPAGGTRTDWIQWCLEVPGVTEAYVFPLRRGAGTVDVVIFTEDGDGNRVNPGAGLISDVEDYLETVRPVTVKSYQVATITELPVNVTYIALTVDEGYDGATQAAVAKADIEAIFPTLEPGQTLYATTDLDATVSAVAGVIDFGRTAPAANVVPTVDPTTIQLLTKGTISVTPA